jgi:hypothetical protein
VTTLQTVRGADVRVGDILVTRWGDRQTVRTIVDTSAEVARVTDYRPTRRAVELWSETYGGRVGWRALPDGLEAVRETEAPVALSCGHVGELPGPAGAPTGYVWCGQCGEGRALL